MLDSCGTSGTGETPQERKRRGGSPPAPRKASILERKLTHAMYTNRSLFNVLRASSHISFFRKGTNYEKERISP
ncbi:hypothetical protein FBF83_20030 [Pseudalkalibacillus hwajinpoensis]|uniref:Uncharacterized protein n=1 Tax=Guptibacillus hwajinpoensis TaxID=208199 RepID=A0A4U1M7U3_9BACL|nr:hypothetical protein [Pseudalkalibacillus hwajinpoensis]TKD66463.1 hypothetical protein FBF83_20030 [Pseudalkalibacillus hwajinpoensis]